jgi:uncharacterized protein YerC
MLLTINTISHLLKRERNQRAIALKTGLSQGTINRIANCKDFSKFENLDSTRQKLSDYFIAEFNYMKKHIIELSGK